MKARVLKNFRDKYNKDKHYKVGEEIEMTKKRYNEILKVDKLVEEITENKKGNQKDGE